jgi:hypothetical protein
LAKWQFLYLATHNALSFDVFFLSVNYSFISLGNIINLCGSKEAFDP